MTAQKRTAAKSTSTRKTADKSPDDSIKYGPPLKPRPVLFIILSIAVALWLIALVVMRLRTVKPPPVLHTEPAPMISR